jgi:hypothetical protein
MAAWQEFLSSRPQVCGGEICATGTRIPVTVILDNLAEGATTRVEQMAERGSRERFLAALDKVPAAEPAPEDRL